MNDSNSSDAAIVALYGIDAPEALNDLYPTVLRWFQDIECTPDKLAVVGDSFSGKQGAFKRIHPRLLRTGILNVQSVNVTSLKPGGEHPICDWKMTVFFAKSPSYFVVGIDNAVADMRWLLDIAYTAISVLHPCYGIGYCRDMQRGADLYAIGLGRNTPYSGPEYEEAVRSTAWASGAMSTEQYRDGILRDVYPYNFLTGSQLQRRVTGVPLKDWIAQDAKRGSLSEICEGTFEWAVEPSEIDSIRKVLQEEGAIFEVGRVQ